MYEPSSDRLEVNVRAVRTANVVEVGARLRGAFRFACSRCAEAAELEVKTEFTHHFVTPGSLDTDGNAERPFDVDPDVSEHNGERIELRDLCIEHAMLALPSYPLCDETCKGLCGNCGVNLNKEGCGCSQEVDPFSPWASLAGIEIESS